MAEESRPPLPEGVLAIRSGPGANCSSIGSVVDMLFGTAVAAGFVYALVASALPEIEKVEEKPKEKEE